MLPTNLLLTEHRLIERMIMLLKHRVENLEGGEADLGFVDVAVDFFNFYIDRTHHGKEEEILFKFLKTKMLAKDHKKILDELAEEHYLGRKMVKRLIGARDEYWSRNNDDMSDMKLFLRELILFYPRHIAKEEEHFFKPAMTYLTRSEQDSMLYECWEFDRKIIHEKYEKVVSDFEREQNLTLVGGRI